MFGEGGAGRSNMRPWFVFLLALLHTLSVCALKTNPKNSEALQAAPNLLRGQHVLEKFGTGSTTRSENPTRCSHGIHDFTMYSVLGVIFLGAVWAVHIAWFAPRDCREEEGPKGAEASSADEREVAKTRYPHLDTAKFLLMVLVFTTHCKSVHHDWPGHHAVMVFINPFCTRCFALVSGIVTSREEPNTASMQRLVFRLAAPLVIFCVFIEPLLVPMALGLPPKATLRLMPLRAATNLTEASAGATWYMFALIVWKLCGWMLLSLRPELRILVALVVSALDGYMPLQAFKLGQAMSSFPVFLIGQLLPYDLVVQRAPWRPLTALWGALLLFMIFAVGFTYTGIHFLLDLPMWGWSGSTFQAQEVQCGAAEAAFIWVRGLFRNVLELTKSCLFLFFVCPHGHKGFITDLGAYTIYPFFLHYTVAILEVRLVGQLSFPIPWGLTPAQRCAAGWFLQIAIGFVVVALLSTRAVRILFGPVLQPKWLEKVMAVDTDERGDPGDKSQQVRCAGGQRVVLQIRAVPARRSRE